MNTTGNLLTGIDGAALRNNTTASFNTAIGAGPCARGGTGIPESLQSEARRFIAL
jgi:hypothetical protein